MAPEWLPERSHDSGRQSNATMDMWLKVARVGDDGTQVGELVNKFDIIVADMYCWWRWNITKFHDFSFGPLVLGLSLQASASKMANADEMSFRLVANMAASSAYSRSLRWYGPSSIPGTMALTFSIR